MNKEKRPNKKKILVVDDDLTILEVIKIILEENGYEVSTVYSGDMIQGAIKKTFPDLILLDYWMSGHDGEEIAKSLRARETTRLIPIVMVSADQNAKAISKSIGINGFLDKPFEIEDLLKLVKKCSSH